MTIDQAKQDYAYRRRFTAKGIPINNAKAALWEFKFRTQAPTRHADREIIIMKKTGIMSEEYRAKYEEWILLPEHRGK